MFSYCTLFCYLLDIATGTYCCHIFWISYNLLSSCVETYLIKLIIYIRDCSIFEVHVSRSLKRIFFASFMLTMWTLQIYMEENIGLKPVHYGCSLRFQELPITLLWLFVSIINSRASMWVLVAILNHLPSSNHHQL